MVIKPKKRLIDNSAAFIVSFEKKTTHSLSVLHRFTRNHLSWSPAGVSCKIYSVFRKKFLIDDFECIFFLEDSDVPFRY